MAESHNQIGNCLMNDSRFKQAAAEYRRALELFSDEPTVMRAPVLSNLGYCQVMVGRSQPGFSNLFRSLRMARALDEVWEMYPRLSLSFAYLQIDRPARAGVHARRGLLLAEGAQMPWQVKNALYLLGESEKLVGHELSAHRHFTRLQEEFYPDDPVIPDFLMATDVRQLINLMA